MKDDLKEGVEATYRALQKRKTKRTERIENEAISFRIEQMCKSNRKKKRGQC